MESFLGQHSEIADKLESGEPFTKSELGLISSALQGMIFSGDVLKEGYQIIQGELVRIEFERE